MGHFARTFPIALFTLLAAISPAAGQETDERSSGGALFGASLLITTTSAPMPDAEGPGYLRPNFHGSLAWPAVGVGIHAGGFVTRNWSLRGEIAFRRAASAPMVEDAQVGHFDYSQLSSTYTSSERLFSVLVGRRIRTGSRVDVHPVGGFALSSATQTLSERRGTYRSGGIVIAQSPADVSVQTTYYGFGGGADLLVGATSPIAFVAGTRLFWFHRTSGQSYYDRSVPPMGTYVVHVSAGVAWRQRHE